MLNRFMMHCLSGVTLFACAFGARANLTIYPMRLAVESNATRDIEVYSRSERPQYVRVRVMQIIDPAGPNEREVELPVGADVGVVVTPSKFAIPVRGKRKVRVISLQPTTSEKAYRLYFEGVPAPDEDTPTDETGASAKLSISMVWGALANVVPKVGHVRLFLDGQSLRNIGTLRAGVVSVVECDAAANCVTHAVKGSIYPGGALELPFRPRPGQRLNIEYHRSGLHDRAYHEELVVPENTAPAA